MLGEPIPVAYGEWKLYVFVWVCVSVICLVSDCVCYEYVDCLCCVDMYGGQCQCDCL